MDCVPSLPDISGKDLVTGGHFDAADLHSIRSVRQCHYNVANDAHHTSDSPNSGSQPFSTDHSRNVSLQCWGNSHADRNTK